MMNKNKNIIGVYGIYDTNTSRWEYVGQSKNVFDRLKKHVFSRLQNVENFEFYLLYEFDEYDLNTMLYYETLSIITLQPKSNKTTQDWFLKNEHADCKLINKNITKDFLMHLFPGLLKAYRYEKQSHKQATTRNQNLSIEIQKLKFKLRQNHIKY